MATKEGKENDDFFIKIDIWVGYTFVEDVKWIVFNKVGEPGVGKVFPVNTTNQKMLTGHIEPFGSKISNLVAGVACHCDLTVAGQGLVYGALPEVVINVTVSSDKALTSGYIYQSRSIQKMSEEGEIAVAKYPVAPIKFNNPSMGNINWETDVEISTVFKSFFQNKIYFFAINDFDVILKIKK